MRNQSRKPRVRVAPSPVPIPVMFLERWFYTTDGLRSVAQLTEHDTLHVSTLASDADQLAAIRAGFKLCQPVTPAKGGHHA